MRKLEFRAYSVDYDIYIYQSDIDSNDEFLISISGDGVELLVLSESWSCGTGEWVDSEYWKIDKSAVIEQFTGLTDKDGVKIYEGDIVNIADDEINQFEDVKYTVRWSEDAKWIVWNSNVDFYDIIDFDLVVIGNIHGVKNEIN